MAISILVTSILSPLGYTSVVYDSYMHFQSPYIPSQGPYTFGMHMQSTSVYGQSINYGKWIGNRYALKIMEIKYELSRQIDVVYG